MDLFAIKNNKLIKLNTLNTNGRVVDLNIVNNDLFMTRTRNTVVRSRSGFYIYDISNHVAPTLKGRFIYAYTPELTSVAVNQDIAFIADKNAGIYAIPVGVNLARAFITADVNLGATLSYNFTWPLLSNIFDIVCKTSAGSCVVSQIDSVNRTAVVNWTLPAMGNNKSYGMYVAIGNYNYFLSSQETLFIP